jgi:hypothetical protein
VFGVVVWWRVWRVILHQNAEFLIVMKTSVNFMEMYKSIAKRASVAMKRTAERHKYDRACKCRKPETQQLEVPTIYRPNLSIIVTDESSAGMDEDLE